MRSGLVLLVLLLSSSPALAQDAHLVRAAVAPLSGEMLITSEPSAGLLGSSRTSLLRFRLREAESTLRDLSDQSDGGAAAYYHLELASLLKLLVTDRQEYYAEFYGRSDTLKSILSGLPESKWKSFFDAESRLHRAMVRAKAGSYLRAAFAGRGAYRAYARLVESHPNFSDARKGLGLLRMAVGSLPGFYRTFLGVLGMKGSVEEGLADINAAADSSLFVREESIILLSLYEIVMDADHGARNRLTSLHQLYSDSPLFAHLEGFALYSDRKPREAERVLRPAALQFRQTEYFYVDYVDFFLADALFRQDRFQEAVTHYQRYLDNHRGPALKATASLRMGLALEMIGHRLAAKSFYADVSATREFDSDQVARRAADRLLHSPMSDTDRKLLLGRNAFDSGRYERAIDVFGGVLSDSNVPERLQAEAAYRLGRVFQEIKRFDEALAAYGRAIALARDPLSRWAPWSEYYSGRVFEELGNVAAAKAALLRAGAYRGGFDYHQALEKNVKVALERLSARTS